MSRRRMVTKQPDHAPRPPRTLADLAKKAEQVRADTKNIVNQMEVLREEIAAARRARGVSAD
jgi:hypothetical protein